VLPRELVFHSILIHFIVQSSLPIHFIFPNRRYKDEWATHELGEAMQRKIRSMVKQVAQENMNMAERVKYHIVMIFLWTWDFANGKSRAPSNVWEWDCHPRLICSTIILIIKMSPSGLRHWLNSWNNYLSKFSHIGSLSRNRQSLQQPFWASRLSQSCCTHHSF
jgi:hypothetical protein